MANEEVGVRSLLKYIIDDIENELREKVTQQDLMDRGAPSRQTISNWIKPYLVMATLDVRTLYAIAAAVNKFAEDHGLEQRYKPTDFYELIGWQSINKAIAHPAVSLYA